MKGLFLYGINGTNDIWKDIKAFFSDFETEYVEYPHNITQNAKSVEDLTKWVYETYKKESFDFIIGHSMGGIIALELVSQYDFQADYVFFIDSNLKPANEFYRNLLLPANMEKIGDFVIGMIKREEKYYSDALKKSLQEKFDYSGYVKNTSAAIVGIYGDRGQESYDRRMDDLCLSPDTIANIHFKFIKNACHMPMLENPQMLADVIMECLNGSVVRNISSGNEENTPQIETKRLLLRKFAKNDTAALLQILKDKEVNTFLPWYPLETIEQAEHFLQEHFLTNYKLPCSYHYAVCLKADNLPIGYISISDNDSHDLGYGLRKEFWHNGIITEACKAVVEKVKLAGLPFITATHDVKNLRSGEVMKKIGMTYQYSYKEQTQPKNILVTYRMYQLNLDGETDRVYRAYWHKYPHFIEENV